MIPVDGDFILKVAPRFSGKRGAAQTRIVGALSAVFASTLADYQINTKLRIAHFMGQVTHECAGFRTTEEFASGAAYEGRRDLGNIHPGDGKRYKGRGLIQLTGRANYREIGAKLGLPLEEDPELAAEPVASLQIACEYWQSLGINRPADRDDLIRLTRLVNGGLNGLRIGAIMFAEPNRPWPPSKGSGWPPARVGKPSCCAGGLSVTRWASCRNC